MNGEPVIIREDSGWAVLYKPHGMPTAPLTENENGTLLSWFLDLSPTAGGVLGRKAIEYGLIHRLDTDTAGLVIIAKNQTSYDTLLRSQQEGLVKKKYTANCSVEEGKRIPDGERLPLRITSRFRPFGPGRKEVRPLFPSMRGYESGGKDYETLIEKAHMTDEARCEILCSLSKGYRHQIRAHLSFLGFPIIGDRLYNARWNNPAKPGADIPLQLFASEISFSDPDTGARISVSLPKLSKMSQ